LLCGGPSEAVVEWSLLSATGLPLGSAAHCPALGRWFHCRTGCTPASGLGGGHPRSHCPVRLWKTQGHGRDKVRLLGDSQASVWRSFLTAVPVGGGEFY